MSERLGSALRNRPRRKATMQSGHAYAREFLELVGKKGESTERSIVYALDACCARIVCSLKRGLIMSELNCCSQSCQGLRSTCEQFSYYPLMMQQVPTAAAQVRIKLAITTAAFTTLNASCMPARIAVTAVSLFAPVLRRILYGRIPWAD